jgi:hypothetical protein
MPRVQRKNKLLLTQEHPGLKKEVIQKISALLAENGYIIFSLATRFKLSSFDFLAVPRMLGPGAAIMVRIEKNDLIQVRFYSKNTRLVFKKIVGKNLQDEPIKFGRPLPNTEKRGGYLVFIAPDQRFMV